MDMVEKVINAFINLRFCFRNETGSKILVDNVSPTKKKNTRLLKKQNLVINAQSFAKAMKKIISVSYLTTCTYGAGGSN